MYCFEVKRLDAVCSDIFEVDFLKDDINILSDSYIDLMFIGKASSLQEHVLFPSTVDIFSKDSVIDESFQFPFLIDIYFSSFSRSESKKIARLNEVCVYISIYFIHRGFSKYSSFETIQRPRRDVLSAVEGHRYIVYSMTFEYR